MSDKSTCLVVDDSSAIRRVVASLFRDLNFDVAEAPTGVHAVEHCKKEVPDIIMLDWNMPEMDGISCLRVLRAMEMPRRPIIVMCTTEIKVSKIQEALAAGADEYIMKPFNRDVLLDKLAQLPLG
ncbi:MAG: response regulator [Rhizomicrobium sp.]|jgi:two-component system chemotaxis response regulator CheY